MKRFILLQLITFIILSPALIAFEGVSDEVSSNWNSQYSTNPVDLRVNSQDMIEDIETKNDDSIVEYKNKVEEKYAGKIVEAEQYFIDVVLSTCETPADYVCPPLTEEKEKEGYRTRLSFIDLKSGRFECSVLNPLENGINQDLTRQSEAVIYSKTFVNDACVEKYAIENNQDNSESIQNLKNENRAFLNEIKQQEFKYTVDYKMNGADEFLDLADILDGIVSFNPEIFDLEQTLLTKELKTNAGFTTVPNDTIITKFEQNLKSIWDMFSSSNFSESRFFYDAKIQATHRDVSASVANSSYFMLLDFWLKSNELVLNIVVTIAFIFVFYNITTTWLLPSLSYKMQKRENYNENSIQRSVIGVMLIISVFSAEVENINIEYIDSLDNTVKTELIQEQTKLQALIQLLYSETNRVADAFAKQGITSYLNSINANSGLFSAAEIGALSSEKIILEKESEKLAQIDREMCAENYGIANLKNKLKEYRDRNSMLGEPKEMPSNSTGLKSLVFDIEEDIDTLTVNPYPKSEREANALYQKSGLNNHTSPYQQLVKINNLEKFKSSTYSPMSLSACYNNKKKMIENDSRIKEIDSKLQLMSSEGNKASKVEYIKLVNELQWKMYAEQGYLSIAYLPATVMLIDGLGVLNDLSEMATNEDNEATVMQDLSEDLGLLALFGGYNLAKMIHVIKEPLINAALDTIGNTIFAITGGTGVAATATFKGAKYLKKLGRLLQFKDEKVEFDILDLKLAALILKNILSTLVIVATITGTILIFTLLFIEKLFAFISSMFLLIYAFSKNQEERVGTALAKIIAVAFKTALIVICVFLALFSLNLVSSLEIIFLNGFFNSMDMIENATWAFRIETLDLSNLISLMNLFFQKYIFYGLSKIAFMVIKIIIVVQMIWKMPAYMYELIYEQIHSVSDSVANTLSEATQSSKFRV